MRRASQLLVLALAPALLPACAAPGSDAGAHEFTLPRTQAGKEDFIASAKLWPSPHISVCWEPDALDPAFEAERGWVQDAGRSTWSAVSAVDFVGWGPCAPGDPGIHIGLTEDAPNTLGLGTDVNGIEHGMRLNFSFARWSPGCQSTREFCIRAGATHELGHALGFAREHGRADTPGWCARENAFGDLSFGDWDLDSIMNYCNPHWTGDGKLSEGDVFAVRALYGRHAGTALVALSDGSALGPEAVFAEDPELGDAAAGGDVLLGDVTGDRRADVVAVDAEGAWHVLAAAEDGLTPAVVFGSSEREDGAVARLGDMDGDGLSDAVLVSPSGEWTVGASNGTGFEALRWIGAMPPGDPLVADVDGDGREDAVTAGADGSWWVALSVGTGLAEPALWASGLGAGAAARFAGDVTGDGRADLVAMVGDGGRWWVASGQGAEPVLFTEGHGALASERLLTDLTGDGRLDALVYERESGAWFDRVSTGSAFGGDVFARGRLGTSLPAAAPIVRTGDLDGDGDDDVLLVWPTR